MKPALVILPRKIIHVAKPAFHGPKLKILQWNCLADGLAQQGTRNVRAARYQIVRRPNREKLRNAGDFVLCPAVCLENSRRQDLFLQEIRQSDADLLCIQELNHHDEWAAGELRGLGYEGIWLPKQPSPAEQFGAPPDGVALYWRRDRFEVVQGPGGEYFSEVVCGGRSKSVSVVPTPRRLSFGSGSLTPCPSDMGAPCLSLAATAGLCLGGAAGPIGLGSSGDRGREHFAPQSQERGGERQDTRGAGQRGRGGGSMTGDPNCHAAALSPCQLLGLGAGEGSPRASPRPDGS